jgi:hypothetical protein
MYRNRGQALKNIDRQSVIIVQRDSWQKEMLPAKLTLSQGCSVSRPNQIQYQRKLPLI